MKIQFTKLLFDYNYDIDIVYTGLSGSDLAYESSNGYGYIYAENLYTHGDKWVAPPEGVPLDLNLIKVNQLNVKVRITNDKTGFCEYYDPIDYFDTVDNPDETSILDVLEEERQTFYKDVDVDEMMDYKKRISGNSHLTSVRLYIPSEDYFVISDSERYEYGAKKLRNFINCTYYRNIRLQLELSNSITSARNAFWKCSQSLHSIEFLSETNITNADYMFAECNSTPLHLDLSKMPNITSARSMFHNCFNVDIDADYLTHLTGPENVENMFKSAQATIHYTPGTPFAEEFKDMTYEQYSNVFGCSKDYITWVDKTRTTE